MKTEQLPLRPIRKPRFRDLKEGLRKAIWGSEKDAALIAVEAGIDPSVLSRWCSENPDDNASKWVNKFIPLLIALGQNGLDIYEYIGEELRAAQERAAGRDLAEAVTVISVFGKTLPRIQQAAEIIIAAQKGRK